MNNVVLKLSGADKIAAIKVVRALTGLGLKEAKDMVMGAPQTVLTGVSQTVAEEACKQLRATGSTVEIQGSVGTPQSVTEAVWDDASAGGGAVRLGAGQSQLVLTQVGKQKIEVIKIVRDLTKSGLKEAKDLVDSAPKVVLKNVDEATAKTAQKQLNEVGASAEIKKM